MFCKQCSALVVSCCCALQTTHLLEQTCELQTYQLQTCSCREVHVAISQSDLSTASELIAKGCIDYMSISSIDSAEDVR